MSDYVVHFVDDLQSIAQDEWNQLTGVSYPFMRHEFLHALDSSGSTGADSGWIPNHFTLRNSADQLVAVAPGYLKEHSYGEYVFDWAWADAYYQHGLAYYPKLLNAIPFTPCAGPRLAIAPSVDAAAVTNAYIDASVAFCRSQKLSSWHLLFPDLALADRLDDAVDRGRLLLRLGSQFHWYNQEYATFADYLQTMTSRKRKSIRREREKVAQQGIRFIHVTGEQINAEQLDTFFLYYHATYYKRGREGYLNRDFFERLIASMPESLLFIFALSDDQLIAGALFFLGDDTLFGRYWGCFDSFKHLHFETCYYQGIDYCITQQLAHFDAGAQGEHKIQRGFEPIETYSYHWIAHPDFRNAIADHVVREQAHVLAYIADAATYLPFKKEDGQVR